jgi:hypothetical protein
MMNAVFWDVTLCGPCNNRHFGRTQESGSCASVDSTANVIPSSPILVTLMIEAMHSSETSGLTRVTRRNMPEDVVLQSMNIFLLAWGHVNEKCSQQEYIVRFSTH